MRRFPVAPAVVTLCASAMVVVGCHSGSPAGGGAAGPGTPTTARSDASAAPSAANTKLMANWPTPAGALILTGEMLGYDEPCGCTAGQKGGLARRFDLVERLRGQGWSLAELDLGSLTNDPNNRTHGGPEETKIRFDYTLSALDQMGYAAVGLGASDLRLSVMGFVGALIQDGRRPPIVSANVAPESALGLGEKFRPSVRTKAGSRRIGVTSAVDLGDLKSISDPDLSLLPARPADEVVPGVLADLEKDTDVQVLLAQGSPDFARRLATANPGFDVVVSTSPMVDPEKDPVLLNDGRTMLVQVGRKGQYVGVVGLFDDPKSPMRYQRVQLGAGFDQKFERMRKHLDGDMQETFHQAGVLESYPRVPISATGAPAGSAYVGAEACKSCHPNTFAKWASTRHARAYDDLVKDPHDPRRNRENDAACVVCHTTGFGYEGGFRTAASTPNLKGNQCENCHGPASLHAADPDDPAYRASVRKSIADFDRNHRCTQCHDEDNAPHGFDLSEKWDQVAHRGLDSYSDPKVHAKSAKGTASRP